jgi:hypothetical protein
VDTTRNIIYRGFYLNEEDIIENIVPGDGAGTGLGGCVTDSFDISDVDVHQFTEKRAQGDGNDAGDVHLGARRVRMSGTLYGVSRNDLYDRFWNLRAALNPVLAQREEPLDYGYRPLYFYTPTLRTDQYPAGFIDLQVRAMPRVVSAVFDRDAQGGEDTDALALPWQATFICKDPQILSASPQDTSFTAQTNVTGTTGDATGGAFEDLFTKASHGLVAGDRITFSALTGGTGLSTGVAYYVVSSGLTSSTFRLSLTSEGTVVNFTTDVTASTWTKSVTDSGNLRNRGNYLAVVNALWEVGAGAGSISATVGDSVFTITVPSSTGTRILRLNGDKNVFTVQEDGGTEETRMDLIDFTGDTTYPLIDPTPDTDLTGDAWSFTTHGLTQTANSHWWFYEAYG